jgi:hypothetical protein
MDVENLLSNSAPFGGRDHNLFSIVRSPASGASGAKGVWGLCNLAEPQFAALRSLASDEDVQLDKQPS